MKKKIIIVIAIVTVLVVGIAIGSFSPTLQKMDGLQTSATSYKYNTICDIGDYEQFMMQEVLSVTGEIMTGQHNENEKVTKFFKTNKYLSMMNITPDQVLEKIISQEKTSNGLAPNYDPIFYDVTFWFPLTLDIMGASPEVMDILVFEEVTSETAYKNRLYSELAECK